MAPNPQANLAAMPQEVFDEILGHLQSDCILSSKHPYRPLLCILCLVSKAVKAKVLAEFADHHFYTINILLSDQESLHSGLRVASNPVYGAAAHNFRLYLDELSSVQDAGIQGPGPDSKTEDALKAWNSLKQAQRHIRDSGEELKLLVLIMCHLRRHGKPIRIITFDSIEKSFSCQKTATQYRALEWEHGPSLFLLEAPQPDNITQVATMIQAISLSNLAP